MGDQLQMLHKRLESEIQTLSQNYSAMKLTQSKYAESDLALRAINPENQDKEILVPLTSSLYIPGKIRDVRTVLVDIGTGYYVKKKTAHAREFFKRKNAMVAGHADKLEGIIRNKRSQSRQVYQILRQKVYQQQQQQQQQVVST